MIDASEKDYTFTYEYEFYWKQTHMKMKCDIESVFNAAKRAVLHSRTLLEQYILEHPEFVTTLDPIELDLNAPEFIRKMMRAGLMAGVGPMAAVAGALSEIASEAMVKNNCKMAIAENGGDISIMGQRPVTIGVYAGENKTAKQLGFKIKPYELPKGICTSAGTVGHSISFGKADAVIVFSGSAFLSDAAATAIANRVKSTDTEGSIQSALEYAENIKEIQGCMVLIGELVGTVGEIPEMVEVLDPDL